MKTTESSLDSIIQIGSATDTYHKIRKGNTITITVTVATKTTSHPHHGSGSSSAYFLNGIESPHFHMVPGNTYKFDQADSSNSGHPLRFYYEANKSTAYSTGITTSGTPGSSGAHTTIVPTDATPMVLHYQCSAHGYMGGRSDYATRNFTGFNTGDLAEGTNLYYTDARARASISVSGDLSYNSSTGVISFTETTAATTRALISVTDAGGDGSLAYNNTTGVITYTGPSASEVRAHISAGTGVTVSNGAISIGQAVATTSDVTFNDLQVDGNTIITGNLTVNGTSTTLNVATLDVEDLNITVGKAATTSSATNGAGLTFGAWSSGTIPTFTWDHANQRFAANYAIAANITGALTGNADTATTLATARTISGVSFNGSANITLNTSAITENTNLYYTNARADARIAAASLLDLSDVGSDGTNGQVLTTDGSGGFTFTTVSGGGSAITVQEEGSSLATAAATINFVGAGVTATGTGATKTITIPGTGTVSEAFKTISVSGQSDVVADTATDTLTLVAGSNMTLTTSASGDTVTFASSGSGGGGSASASDIRTKFVYTTSSSTTAFSGSDDNSATLSYTLGAVDVYLNGVLQKLTTDYAETNTSTITFVNAIASGNVVEIIAYYRTIGTGNSVVDQFTGNGSATDYTVTTAPVSENNLLVYIDGVYQQKTDYTVSGTTLAFDTAPASGAVIETVAMVGAITEQASLTLTGALTSVSADLSGDLTVAGNISLDGSNKELRFYEGSNYVGFEAPALSADKIWVLPAADGTAGYALKTDGSGNLSWGLAGGNAFETISVSGQSDVVADSSSDTLTLAAGTGLAITTAAGSDTITFTNTAVGANAFGTIAVSGQSNVVADSTADTLTLAAGAGIVLTTAAGSDTVTIAGGSGSVFTTDLFTASGSQNAYTLSVAPASEDEIMAFVEGVYQNKNSYALSGTTLTFDAGITNGQEVVVHHIGAGIVGTSPNVETFTGNGSAYSYTLSVAPPNENYLQVFWDGVYQNHDQYTVSGTTLDFGSGNVPANATAIEVVYPSINGIGTPSDASVTPAKLSTGAPSWDGNSNFIVGNSYVRSDSTSVSATSATTVATHAVATYRTVKYQVQVTQGSAYHTTELTAIHDGTNVALTEYGTVFTGSSLATFDATITSGNMLLQVTMGSSSSSTIKVISSAISV